jgi:hypothetical protein
MSADAFSVGLCPTTAMSGAWGRSRPQPQCFRFPATASSAVAVAILYCLANLGLRWHLFSILRFACCFGLVDTIEADFALLPRREALASQTSTFEPASSAQSCDPHYQVGHHRSHTNRLLMQTVSLPAVVFVMVRLQVLTWLEGAKKRNCFGRHAQGPQTGVFRHPVPGTTLPKWPQMDPRSALRAIRRPTFQTTCRKSPMSESEIQTFQTWCA